MSIISGVGAGLGGAGDSGGALGSFFSTTVDNSLRLTSANSSRLTFSQGSPTDISKWTVNFWLKRSSPLEDSSDYDTVFGVNGPGNTAFTFLSGQIYLFINYNVGGSQARLITNRVFRDPSAWYNFHVSFDRANSTNAHKVRLYVNGVEETSFATDERNLIDGSSSTGWNVSGENAGINSRSGDNADRFHDGYLAQFYNIDGAVVAPTEFAETKDGVWIPKAYSGSYGNNGWLLEFKQTGTGTASSSTVGADTSGNNNHWTSSGIAAHDVMLDSPTNNFATMNSIYHSGAQGTLSEGNLKVSGGGFVNTANGYGAVSTFTIPKDKKIYIEVECTDQAGNYWMAGFATKSGLESGPSSTTVGGSNAITMYNRSVMLNGSENDYGSSSGLGGFGISKFSAGDILGMAIDGATGKVWFSRNGTYFGAPQGHQSGAGSTGDPAAGSNEIGTITGGTTEDVFVIASAHGSTNNLFINFGQDSQNVASAQSDGEGIGTFEYAPPTGYVSLCAANLTTPEIGPTKSSQADDHFNTVLWTGNGSTQSITGVGFQPDWSWLKSRSNAQGHNVFDSVRGANKALFPNDTNAEFTDTDRLTSFDSDGFSLGADANVNTNNYTYVAWNWKAGGSASSNSDGSITSSVSANTAAGFAVGTYTGNATAGATIGHGLGAIPEMVIVKRRDNARDWAVYHKEQSATPTNAYLLLNSTASIGVGSTAWNNGTFTTDVFTIGSHELVNANTDSYVFYAFKGIEGYSKFGSYLANGSTDGPFVFTGFRPAFVFTKESSSTSGWNMRDSVRSPENVVNEVLQADTADAEMTSNYNVDFLSNGFKVRASASDSNASGQTYIYWAIAEAPFKFSNAR
jgi:hypothetical protein